MSICVEPRTNRLIIERMFDGRRFRVSTGLPNTKQGNATARMYEGMLLTLREGGRMDVVWALGNTKSGVEFPDVWEHFRKGNWRNLPTTEHMLPLYETAFEWIPKARKVNGDPWSVGHTREVRQAFVGLQNFRARATVADAPGLLRDYRAYCEKRGIGRQFRKAKNALQAFLREKFGKRKSALWAEISDIADVSYERDVMLALEPQRAIEIRNRLTPPHARIWWSLCCSGMMPDELWGADYKRPQKWRINAPGLNIGGTKTDFRPRVVPLIDTPTYPERTYRAHLDALHKVAKDLKLDGRLTCYVARRTYQHWLESCGIQETRVRLYMGHVATDPHQLYPIHDVTPHLVADGKLLSDYIGLTARAAMGVA